MMMKFYIYTFLIAILFTGSIYSQDTASKINVGDVFTIAEANHYKHIHFPRSNFIIKKGGIPNYNTVVGENVEVTSIKEDKDGNLVAKIKLTSKKDFFRSHKYLKVDIEDAIREKELVKTNIAMSK